MPYVLFHEYFPETAKRETRTITVPDPSCFGVPAGDYGLLELSFCDEPGCDCRRVLFSVLSRQRNSLDAVIAYGWESLDFYTQWMRDDDPDIIATLKGLSLNLMSPQSKHAPALLDLLRDMLFRDSEYVERIQRHYRMFREKIDGKPGRRPNKKKRMKQKKKRKQ